MRQTLLTIVLVGLIIATIVVWYVYIRSPAGENTSVSSIPSPESGKILQYRELKNLKPDTSILSDSLFQSLTRYRAPNAPAPQSPGRVNPFVPF